MKRPMRHPSSPPPARTTGYIMAESNADAESFPPEKRVEEMRMPAAVVATKDSSRSEQFPAISFTLSPMKSAMTLGTLLSSSGRSWRSLARISDEISAALV